MKFLIAFLFSATAWGQGSQPCYLTSTNTKCLKTILFNSTTPLQLNGSTSGTLTQNASAVTTNYSLTWPASQGGASTVLQNNGSGVLSWAASSSASPGGSNSFVQFNNSGSFGGDAGFKYLVGLHSVQLGTGTSITGNYSLVMGSGSSVTNDGALALGGSTVASGIFSLAAGNTVHVSGTNAAGFGESNTGSAEASLVTGVGNTAQGFSQSIFGTYAVPQGTDIGSLTPGDDLLIVGNGSSGTPSSALEVATSSIKTYNDLSEINSNYSADQIGSPGSFIGNISDNDQTQHQIVVGSSDTASLTNNTSNVAVLAGNLTGPGEAGNGGRLDIGGGSITSGSGTGNGGVFNAFAGSADAGNGGNAALSGGSSNSGSGGNVLILAGTGATTGFVRLEGSSIQAFNDLVEVDSSYTSNFLASPSTFIGNVSDNDQTNGLIAIGSKDTAVAANNTSSVSLQAGTNTAAAATGTAGNAVISGGNILTGSGSSGGVFIIGGNSDTGPSGQVLVTSGTSNGGATGGLGLGTGFVLAGTGQSGSIAASTGNVNNATLSGAIDWFTGANAGSGNSGHLQGTTGNVSGAGLSGSIFFSPGTAASGTTGNIELAIPVGGIAQGHIKLDASYVLLNNTYLTSNQTTVPTATVNSNAGTGATSTVTHATDIAGVINLTTGSVSTSSGEQTKVNFQLTYSVAPVCELTPANDNASLDAVVRGVYVTSTTTALSVNFANAETVGTSYIWNYHCIETQ